MQRKAKQKGGGGGTVHRLAGAIEVELEGIFQKALSANQKSDLQIYLTYADHLRFRQHRDRCLQVIEEALQQPAAAKPASVIPVMGLHAVAVEMALSKQDDADRYEKAAKHVQALLASSEPRFQGLGHLFQGAIELEQSGLIHATAQAGRQNELVQPAQPKLRASALNHLKLAAASFPRWPRRKLVMEWRWFSTRSRPWAGSISRTPCGWATSSPSISSGRPGRFFRRAIPRKPNRSSKRYSASLPRGRFPLS